MKIRITRSEWWPVYTIGASHGDEVEVDEETAKRWDRVDEEFADVQMEMARVYDNQITRKKSGPMTE